MRIRHRDAQPPQRRPRVLGTLLVFYLIWLVVLSWLAILALQGE
jgi:hypothetical protein